jgi:hypothetical protein
MLSVFWASSDLHSRHQVAEWASRAGLATWRYPDRSDAFVLVQVTLSAGRATAAKQGFYARLAQLLNNTVGLRPEDLAIVLVENTLSPSSPSRPVDVFGHAQTTPRIRKLAPAKPEQGPSSPKTGFRSTATGDPS